MYVAHWPFSDPLSFAYYMEFLKSIVFNKDIICIFGLLDGTRYSCLQIELQYPLNPIEWKENTGTYV